MTRAYNVVDADGHILEPLDLWDTYMSPEAKHQVLGGGALGFYGMS
jgi:hypothetical protein